MLHLSRWLHKRSTQGQLLSVNHLLTLGKNVSTPLFMSPQYLKLGFQTFAMQQRAFIKFSSIESMESKQIFLLHIWETTGAGMDSQFRGFIPVIAPRILIFLYSSFLQFLFSFYTHRSEFLVFCFFFWVKFIVHQGRAHVRHYILVNYLWPLMPFIPNPLWIPSCTGGDCSEYIAQWWIQRTTNFMVENFLSWMLPTEYNY